MEDYKPGIPLPTSNAQASGASAPERAGLQFPSGLKAAHTQAPVYAGLLVGGIIVGVLLATAWSSLGPGAPATTASTSASEAGIKEPAAPVSVASPAQTDPPIVVEDQAAGGSVAIESLNIARPVWVVVYVSREGKPGLALGARLFFPADRQGSVGLLRDTEPGQTYFVGLSVDDGDKAFSVSKDLPLAAADGGPLWATFRAR